MRPRQIPLFHNMPSSAVFKVSHSRKPIRASSQRSPTEYAARANDGNEATQWASGSGDTEPWFAADAIAMPYLEHHVNGMPCVLVTVRGGLAMEHPVYAPPIGQIRFAQNWTGVKVVNIASSMVYARLVGA